MTTGIPISLDRPNICLQWPNHTSTRYHTNPITIKTHPTANIDWKFPIILSGHRCDYVSIIQQTFHTPNHWHQGTHQINHKFIELPHNSSQRHYWIQSKIHDIIYPHWLLPFKIFRRTKLRRQIFLLRSPTTRPHQTTHSTNITQCTTIRIMLHHAQNIGIIHERLTGCYFYQRPKRSTNANHINQNGPLWTHHSHSCRKFVVRKSHEQYFQTAPLTCHQHDFLLDQR